MEAARNPDYLSKTAEAVTEFKKAFERLLALYVENTAARGIAPPVLPRDGIGPEVFASSSADVARAAGRASMAPGLTQMSIVVGGRTVDPIAAWRSAISPKPLLEPADVLDAAEQILGRLEAMTLKAEVERPPTVGVEAMHPTVWGAARKLYLDGYFRMAIHAAGEAIVQQLKVRMNRYDLDATPLWQQAFSNGSPTEDSARLRWPGDPSDKTVISMNSGLRQFAPGVQMTIRNAATHGADEMGAQEALERLAALSLLARWVEECEVHTA